MLDTKHAFISAYLKGQESKVMTAAHIDRMCHASSIQDALAVITATDIGGYLQEVPLNTFGDLDEYLWRYLSAYIARIEAFKLLPGDLLEISKAYIAKYDVSNIKTALRGIMAGKKANMIPLGLIHNHGLLGELSSAGSIGDIIELLTRCGLGDYASVLKEYRIDEDANSRLLAEAKLDGEYYKNLLNITRGVRDGLILGRAFGLIIDLTNLQIASRAVIEDLGQGAAERIIAGGYMLSAEVIRGLSPLKLSDMPGKMGSSPYRKVVEEISASYHRTQSVTSVEEIIDKYKFSLVKEILSPRILSPLVIAWHIILKELEIQNLRLILKAMLDNIPPEEVRQYLVLSL